MQGSWTFRVIKLTMLTIMGLVGPEICKRGDIHGNEYGLRSRGVGDVKLSIPWSIGNVA